MAHYGPEGQYRWRQRPLSSDNNKKGLHFVSVGIESRKSREVKIMKRVVLLFLFAGLGFGCAVTPKQIYTPEGKRAYVISCESAVRGQCHQKASQICGSKGYDILKVDVETGGTITLLIACRE